MGITRMAVQYNQGFVASSSPFGGTCPKSWANFQVIAQLDQIFIRWNRYPFAQEESDRGSGLPFIDYSCITDCGSLQFRGGQQVLSDGLP
jgi:hypothetical protein